MKIKLLISLLFLTALPLKAEIRLPHFFSDNMVLQRGQEVKIWGWGDNNEKIILYFNGQTQTAKADKNGKWQVVLEAMQASSTPLEMKIKGKNEITIKNILIGDVWICGGQSNMEWTVANSNNSVKAVETAQYPHIRLLDVPRHVAFKPVEDIQPARWQTAEGNNISQFSAVGYFFGRHIHENHQVPIGLISCNWGGTRAETWTSAEKLTPFEYTSKPIEVMKNMNMDYDEYVSKGQEGIKKWIEKYYPQNDIGDQGKWYENTYAFDDWKSIEIPSAIEEQPGLEDFDGVVWLKKIFNLPTILANKDLFLRLGKVANMDIIYVNGIKVMENYDPNRWRSYKIPLAVLNPRGKNIITIKLFNPSGKGGLIEVNRAKFAISPAQWDITGNDIILTGEWKYKISNQLEKPIAAKLPKPKRIRPDDFPSSLYNGMLHPLIPIAIKGAIWYQGESNANDFDNAVRYQEVFPTLIKDWRERWGYDFDFYFVQLANYSRKRPGCEDPCEQSWAYVRESQAKALNLPQTGMAVIIDVGNPVDIHPRDKETVGTRLGLIADAKAYGKTNKVFSGPIYQSYEGKGKEIWLTFDHTGSGLLAKDRYGYLKGFQIAGADKVFHWAEARIENGKVVVYADKVAKPLAVRYAWENNPEDANLYNQEGLPASPFRTDNWVLYPEK